MLYIVIGIGLAFMLLERLIPDQKLHEVKGWWIRVMLINFAQICIIYLGSYTWDKWFLSYSVFNLSMLHPAIGALIAYFIISFIFYWWHRVRHDVNMLWILCHQVHHSARRIETITSFFKHPLEIVLDSMLIALVNLVFLGIGVEGSAWTMLYTACAEYFYHMNIKTPHWLGYIIQRPEMHRIHHMQGKHYKNFADLPVWDMLFGTYENPLETKTLCGFKPEREQRFTDMLLFKNVNNAYQSPNKNYEK